MLRPHVLPQVASLGGAVVTVDLAVQVEVIHSMIFPLNMHEDINKIRVGIFDCEPGSCIKILGS